MARILNTRTNTDDQRRGLALGAGVAFVLLLATQCEAFAPVSIRNIPTRTQQQQQTPAFTDHTKFGTSASTSLTSKIARQSSLSSASALQSSSSSNDSYDDTCDVLVLGSGPAARAIASLLGADQNLEVLLADQNFDRQFAPNYGVWHDEWAAVMDAYQAAGVTLQGGQCGRAIDREWKITDCFFGGSFDMPTEQRMRLDRPYYRVDKEALRDSLTLSDSYRVLKANHISKATGPNMYEPAGSLQHDAKGSTIQLQEPNGNLLSVRTKLIVDCTGHETQLVLKETRQAPQDKPGYQIAYGILADVETASGTPDNMIGPYDKEAMTLFDYRTDHYDDTDDKTQTKVASAPTFMYAMPLKDNQIFFEETSLVARPAISFQECKDRCYKRLEHLGITVTKVYEEEFCYIPMGGPLPAKDQRILALGGAAAMVHPSTGYHLCRCLMGAKDMAQAIQQGLASQTANSDDVYALNRIAASAYNALWTPENIRQRNFAVFGGEFLMKQNVVGLRGFFDGFFRLPLPMWAGFLAGWPGLPNNDQHETWYKRMLYGLTFVTKLPPQIAGDMLLNIIGYSIEQGVPLPQSVTPFLGEPPSYEFKRNTDSNGDVAAKREARAMLQASKVEEVVPVAFEATSSSPQPSVEPESKPIELKEAVKETNL